MNEVLIIYYAQTITLKNNSYHISELSYFLAPKILTV